MQMLFNVTNFGKDNIYSFKYKGKNIILRLAKPKGCNGKHDISKLLEWNLHILKCKKFERDGIDALSRLIVTLHRMSAHVIRFDRLKDEYLACLDFGIIYDEVSYRNHHEYVDFLVENGYLFKVTKLCIPRTSFRDLLIWEMHADGLARHSGRDKTIALIEDRFNQPSLKKDVARIVAQCRTCKLAKAKKQNTDLYTILPVFS